MIENHIADVTSTKNNISSEEKLKIEKYDKIQTLIDNHVEYIKSL